MGIKFDKWDDKNWHMLAGTIISIIIGLVFYCLIDSRIWLSLLVGLFTGVIAGIAKEVYDKYIKKTMFNFEDMRATFWGALAGTIILIPILVNI